jgi:DNA-binding HxlR family transcriptional regulator
MSALGSCPLMVELPLLTDLPPITQRHARERLAAALVRIAADLRAMNGHLDLASTAILTAIELGHLEGKPATEATLSRTTGLSKQTVARRLDVLIAEGEVLRVLFHYRGQTRPSVVYVLNPETANDPPRVRRVRDAIRHHAREMEEAMRAMERAEDDDNLRILPANGGVSTSG